MRHKTFVLCLVAVLSVSCSQTCRIVAEIKREGQNALNERHRGLLARADVSVTEAAKIAKQDPLRPAYHLTAPAYWINDPDGPIYFEGKYHVFFQHNPYGSEWGNMSWGHAVSEDMVHWEHQPIALVPNPHSYDKDGVFSGCCVVHDGVPTIICTGVWPEVQCIARSYDGMKTWIKYEGNPVIPNRPRADLQGFRDPFAWKEGDTWYLVLGSGIKGEGGAALLYESSDLVNWEYMHPLCVDFGENWECPNFFALGDKHVLVVSPHADVKYSVGTYENHRFTPGPWRLMDLGGREGFYAPNSFVDERGRRIMWGWISGGGTQGYPWNGVLTLPRVLSLRSDGLLSIQPAEQLTALRGKHNYFEDVTVAATNPTVLVNVEGDCLEILVEFERTDAEFSGLELRRSDQGIEKTVVGYYWAAQRLLCGNKGGEFKLLADEQTLTLHIFLDRSVVEVYANSRQCLTARTYPRRSDSVGVSLVSRGRPTQVICLDVWQMYSIW